MDAPTNDAKFLRKVLSVVVGGRRKNRKMAARALPMEEVNTEDVEPLYQAVSPNNEPCDCPATVRRPTATNAALSVMWYTSMNNEPMN